LALSLFRFGHEEGGRRRLAEAIDPPTNPPPFPYVPPVTLDELERKTAQLSTAPVTAAPPPKGDPGR
jgi:hypothetical protein